MESDQQIANLAVIFCSHVIALSNQLIEKVNEVQGAFLIQMIVHKMFILCTII